MFYKDLNDSEVLIVFTLTEISPSCSKPMIGSLKLPMEILRSLFEKRIQENYVY